MIEKQYTFTQASQKIIERIIEDDNVGINHMVLNKSEALPEHFSNSNVYLIVVRGTVSLRLNDQPPAAYPTGSIIAIPYRTRMNVGNESDETLEFFVVKAPSPQRMTQSGAQVQ